jgi:uncharacterized membrane protein YfcA
LCRRDTVRKFQAMDDLLILLAVTGLVFLVAGFVKGVIGLGLPTIAMGLLSLTMKPAEAAAILILPSFVTNVWQLGAGPRLVALVHRLWSLLVAVVVGTVGGALLLGAVDNPFAASALGAALVLYALIGLSPLRPRIPPRFEPWLGPLVGFTTGLVTAATGVFVIPAVPYLQALDLERDDLVQALGLSFTVSTLALAGALARDAAFALPHIGASVLAMIAALAGMIPGQWLRGRMRPEAFRLLCYLALLAIGIDLLLR